MRNCTLPRLVTDAGVACKSRQLLQIQSCRASCCSACPCTTLVCLPLAPFRQTPSLARQLPTATSTSLLLTTCRLAVRLSGPPLYEPASGLWPLLVILFPESPVCDCSVLYCSVEQPSSEITCTELIASCISPLRHPTTFAPSPPSWARGLLLSQCSLPSP
ncbi:hypothetical protein BCV70DRAFT_51736 [Testicularia cyperi]|uniref:Uncharacterized protein n=1 Tax=Testicularia cyperi TaxID=1882483 RepID=A0A317XVB6_9BASI|nr:hypothetical protein BCV70DRAFT_51736 [Testicularia cyperi]